MPYLIPPFLQKGDKVCIVSTARKISTVEVQPAIDFLQNLGLQVETGKFLFEESHQFAGTDQQRLTDLQQALDNTEIKAIFCARGGYGTVRIIDQLNFDAFKTHPKWIVGYSDITALHNHINQNYQIATLHATMPINISTNTKESLQSLRNALFGDPYHVEIHNHILSKNNHFEVLEGVIVGGNLSMLYSLTGTSSQINPSGNFLFLEDLDEYLYHIDRMMMNLKRCGMLNNLKALLIGGMTDMNDNNIPFGKAAEEIILEAVSDYDYPVLFGVQAGHLKNNQALIMGQTVQLTPSMIEFNK